jgi:bacterioferritin
VNHWNGVWSEWTGGVTPKATMVSRQNHLGSEATMATYTQTETPTGTGATATREELIQGLNEDLAREYQAIIAYVVYSQVLKGAQYMFIAEHLKMHASQELQHAIMVAKQIDYLGGMPTVTPQPVKVSDDPQVMLRADLDNERETIRQYRRRVLQSESLGEFAMSETLREILKQEQDHLIDLATALNIEPPDPGIA